MTDQPKVPPPADLDVDAVIGRHAIAQEMLSRTSGGQTFQACVSDVPRLVAEVRRLRERWQLADESEAESNSAYEEARAKWIAAEARAEAAEAERDQLRAALRMDKPWPFTEVLIQFHRAVVHFMDHETCDMDGWEMVKGADVAGQEILAALALPSPPSSDREKPEPPACYFCNPEFGFVCPAHAPPPAVSLLLITDHEFEGQLEDSFCRHRIPDSGGSVCGFIRREHASTPVLPTCAGFHPWRRWNKSMSNWEMTDLCNNCGQPRAAHTPVGRGGRE